jgi:hypothetical protein
VSQQAAEGQGKRNRETGMNTGRVEEPDLRQYERDGYVLPEGPIAF